MSVDKMLKGGKERPTPWIIILFTFLCVVLDVLILCYFEVL